jgi:hypothetical protein
MFVDAFAMRFPLPRGHSSHHRPPTTAGLWDPQTTCTSLSTSGPDATSQSQVDLKVYIGLSLSLSLSLYLGNLDRVSVLQEHSAKEPPLTNVHG